MRIPLPDFETPASRVNKILDSLQRVQTMKSNQKQTDANTAAQLIQNQFLQPNLQEALKKSQIENKLLEPNLQSEIDQRRQNMAYQNMIMRSMQQKLPYEVNQLKMKQENPLFGMRGMPGDIGAINQLLKQADQQRSQPQQFDPSLIPGQQATGIASQIPTPNIYEQQAKVLQDAMQANIAQKLAKSQSTQNIAMGRGVTQQAINGLYQDVRDNYPDASEEKVRQIVDAHLSGEDTLPNGEKLKEPTGTMKAHINTIVKNSTDLSMRKVIAGAKLVEVMENKVNIPALQYYTGLKGKARLEADKGKASLFGIYSPTYSAYLSTIRGAIPQMADQLRKQFGASISYEMNKQLIDMADPHSVYTDARTVKEVFDYLKNLLSDEKRKNIEMAKNSAKLLHDDVDEDGNKTINFSDLR